MRAFASTIAGLGCAVLLGALPQLVSTPTGREPSARTSPADSTDPTASGATPAGAVVGGATHTLPLAAAHPTDAEGGATPDGSPAVLLDTTETERFSLLGITWEDPDATLPGRAEVRVRDAATDEWSQWQPLEAHPDDRPDARSPEGAEGVRGATSPLWVGPSDGVAVRLAPEPAHADHPHTDAEPATHSGSADSASAAEQPAEPLPEGLRLDLVDPGEVPSVARPGSAPAPEGTEHPEGGEPGERAERTQEGDGTEDSERPGESAGSEDPDPAEQPAETEDADQSAEPDQPAEPDRTEGAEESEETEEADETEEPDESEEADETEESGQSHGDTPEFPGLQAPRPAIVTRAQWGADESLRSGPYPYTSTVKAAFVHHTATGNDYACEEVPALLRSIYRYHVLGNGWRDVGYNFFVDRCGTIYEGRAGGVAEPVLGAHSLGFNSDTTGIAVLGTFTDTAPTPETLRGLEQLVAWKLGLFDQDAAGTTTLVSSDSGSLYPAGTAVTFDTVSGHRDGFSTDCPGGQLYDLLPQVREGAAALQAT
ncbi:N-acetylmuramoyl-L-alanine amidase [Allostreptomyces psammosilenae]|uniref:Peptidoglycan recognition protein family domain-containing protein n=1 Tax=Allostreptomyces psammosilenae TaxID=1892865 RepID=A0A852ZWT0_9ACTN|nr:N-acetylmuramoyl-L-alanine amidase [Allostreptomyces psammosilenae]NYI06147.1 hypothetical protein [Allostreptomyces psammosilenae]